MDKPYSKIAPYYNIIYRKNYKKEAERLKKIIIGHFLRKNISVLDVGCGAGNHIFWLSKTFENIEGVEPNPTLLEIASKKNPTKNFYLARMQDMKLKKKYDVILCLFSTILYNRSYVELGRTLQNFYLHLKPNGMLIFDMTPEKKLRKFEEGITSRGKIEIKWQNKPSKRITKYSIFVKTHKEEHSECMTLGIFNKDKIIKLAEKIGFRVVHTNGLLGKVRDVFICYKPRVGIPEKQAPENFRNSLVISLTDRCNFHCSYCFQDAGAPSKNEISREEIVRFLKLFKSQSKKGQKIFVQFTGGEVLLKEDFFDILSDALSLGYVVRFCTNGSLVKYLPKEKLKILKNENVFIKVSLDGSKRKIHEIYRDKNSFDNIVRGIRIIRKLNKNVSMKAVITKENINDIKNMLKLCSKLGIGFTYNILRLQGRGKQKRFCKVDSFEVFKKIFEILEKNKKYIDLILSTDFSHVILSYFLDNFKLQDRFYLFIGSDGTIYPNQNLQIKQFKIGLLGKTPLHSLFLNLERKRNEITKRYEKPCRNCKLKAYCENKGFKEFYEGFSSCKELWKIIDFIEKKSPNPIFKEILNKVKSDSIKS